MRLTKRWWTIVLIVISVVIVLLIRSKALLITKAHPVALQLEGWRIYREISDYRTRFTDSFTIHYRDEDESAVLRVESLAARLGFEVLQYFDHHPSVSIPIVLYSQEDELKGILRIPHEQSAMGAYAGGVINLLSTESLMGLEQDPDSQDNVFVHELAHLALDGKAKGNYPLWFTEGSALYMEYVLLEYEWGMGMQVQPSYSLEDMTYRFSSLDEQVAYRQAFLMVKQMVEAEGWEKYLEFLDMIGSGTNFQEALQDRYGNDIFS